MSKDSKIENWTWYDPWNTAVVNDYTFSSPLKKESLRYDVCVHSGNYSMKCWERREEYVLSGIVFTQTKRNLGLGEHTVFNSFPSLYINIKI